jgi:glycosyltransferase involved in cell wall biosynthesis
MENSLRLDLPVPENSQLHDSNLENMTLLFAGHDFKFLRPVIEYFDLKPEFRVLLDRIEGHMIRDVRTSATLLTQADIVFCEWCLGNAVWYSRNKLDHQRLIVRLHHQEIGPSAMHYLDGVKWGNVDRLIFICQNNMDRFLERFPEMSERSVLIYNLVDCSHFDRPKTDEAMFNLGVLGTAPCRKAPHLALDILELLRSRDSRYRLHIKGHHPWEYEWLWRQPKERAYYDSLYKRLRELETLGAVVLEEHGDDVAEWFRNIGFILSTSEHEGSHQAVAEGMASGAIPIVRNWAGAETLYPQQFIFDSCSQAVDLIMAHTDRRDFVSESDASRQYALGRFDSERILAQYSSMLGEMVLSKPDRPLQTLHLDDIISKIVSAERVAEIEQARIVKQELIEISLPGTVLVLVDEARFGNDPVPERHTLPFLEQDGEYAGPPADDDTAILEFERLRAKGASFIAFAWMAFWWLDYYKEFDSYLRSAFPCVIRNERLVVFDLQHRMDSDATIDASATTTTVAAL